MSIEYQMMMGDVSTRAKDLLDAGCWSRDSSMVIIRDLLEEIKRLKSTVHKISVDWQVQQAEIKLLKDTLLQGQGNWEKAVIDTATECAEIAKSADVEYANDAWQSGYGSAACDIADVIQQRFQLVVKPE
jgi:hypothetical protein